MSGSLAESLYDPKELNFSSSRCSFTSEFTSLWASLVGWWLETVCLSKDKRRVDLLDNGMFSSGFVSSCSKYSRPSTSASDGLISVAEISGTSSVDHHHPPPLKHNPIPNGRRIIFVDTDLAVTSTRWPSSCHSFRKILYPLTT